MAKTITFRTNAQVRAEMTPHERKTFESDQHELHVVLDDGSSYKVGLTDDQALDLARQISAADLDGRVWAAGYRATVAAQQAQQST